MVPFRFASANLIAAGRWQTQLRRFHPAACADFWQSRETRLDRRPPPEDIGPTPSRSGGRVVMQRTANPRMWVRFPPGPPMQAWFSFQINALWLKIPLLPTPLPTQSRRKTANAGGLLWTAGTENGHWRTTPTGVSGQGYWPGRKPQKRFGRARLAPPEFISERRYARRLEPEKLDDRPSNGPR